MIYMHNSMTFESQFENLWKTNKPIWKFDGLMEWTPKQMWEVIPI